MGNLCVTDQLDKPFEGSPSGSFCPGPGLSDGRPLGSTSGKSFDSKYEADSTETIGIGAFSQVFLCWRKDDPDCTYALKLIDIDAEAKGPLKMIYEEIKIMQVLGSHPSIMHLEDVYNELNEDRREIRMVLELCEGGDLLDRVHKKGFYPEDEAILLVSNVLRAITYIHSKGIMHRDVKPENVLLTSFESDTDVKISDFGLAKIEKNFPRVLPRSRSLCGSDLYLAPEVIKQQEYGREVDVWAVGVVTYGMLCGSLPFLHSDLQKVYAWIIAGDLKFSEKQWANVSNNARHFIRSLMEVECIERLTAEEALDHPWLNGEGTPRSIGSDVMQSNFSNDVRPNGYC